MRLSDALKEQRGALLDKMTALSELAECEQRLFSDDEGRQFDSWQREVAALDVQLTRQLAAESLRRSGGNGPRAIVDADGKRHAILRSGDKLAARHPPRGDMQPFDLAEFVRVMLTGDRSHNESVQRAMSIGSLPGGGYSVPADLSATWLDAARAASVCIAAGAGTTVMEGATLRIAEVVTDPGVAFKAENAAFPINDAVFGAVDLTARTVGVVVKSSMELLADSPIASDMLITSLTNGLALAMDVALLKGDGVAPNPRGILANAGIGDVPVGGALADYDPFLDAMALVEAANLAPKSVINNPANVNTLRKLVTGLVTDITKAPPPPDYAALQRLMSTSMPATNALVGDFQWAALALREGVTIEASRVAGDATSSAMVNGQIWIRAYARMDSAVLRPKAFAKLSGIA